jgi:predicted Zn-dependent protease
LALSEGAPSWSGPVRVALPPRIVADAIDWIARCAVAESSSPGTTWFGAGRTLHKRIHVTDDRATRAGLRSAPFDHRGVPPQRLLVLREGVPCATYLPLGAESPTGHAWKATPLDDGELPLRPGNLLLNGGLRSLQALRAEMQTQIFHVEEADLTQADPVTGDFSCTAHGVMWDGTTCLGGLTHVKLAGNLLDALTRVAAVSSETDRVAHVDAPALVVDGLRMS